MSWGGQREAAQLAGLLKGAPGSLFLALVLYGQALDDAAVADGVEIFDQDGARGIGKAGIPGPGRLRPVATCLEIGA